MNTQPPNAAGFSLVEALVSLTVTLLAVTFVLQGTRMVDSVYRVDSRASDETAEAKWAFDDIADELTRAGFGMGATRSVLPFLAEDPTPSSRHLTLRSSPGRRTGVPRDEVVASGVAVTVSDAGLFRIGDRVLLSDRAGSESAEVASADGETLSFSSLETPDGRLRGSYSPERRARVLGLREVRFGFERTGAGSVLWKEISGGERRILSRSLHEARFEHLDAHGRTMTPDELETGERASTVRIHLRLEDSAPAGSISSLTTAVALGRHSATIDLPMVTPPHLTDTPLVLELGPVIDSPMGTH